MILDLLKRLPGALGRYVFYRTRRLLAMRTPSNPVQKAATTGLPGNSKGLDEAYLTTASWPVYRKTSVPPELSNDPLFQLWAKTRGGTKWSHYFSVYREVFGHLTDLPLRILEIGVYQGASLDLWKKYFTHPETIIVGIDIEPACARLDSLSAGKRVRIGSQTDLAFLTAVVREFGPFDLIIDDGSHRTSDVIQSFNHLFSSGLKDSGIYFVEDLHAGYWSDWRNTERTFLDVCLELVEIMHTHYKIAGPETLFAASPPDHIIEVIDVPRITTMIREIRFFDSMVAIHKAQNDYVPFAIWMDNQRGIDWVTSQLP